MMPADNESSPCAGRVLVVDDDRAALEIVRHFLQKEGYDVLLAQSGRECLDLIDREHIDVILLDVVMPGMDGFEVCAELRKSDRGRDIPVILLTARDDMNARKAGMRLGVSEFLTKPLDRHELTSRVKAQLHIRHIEHRLDNLLSD